MRTLRYLLVLIVSINHLQIVVSEDDSGTASDSQLYTPIITDQYDECVDVTCLNEPSLDACQNKAYEMAGNMFTFKSTDSQCCIKTCDRNLLHNSSIYSIDTVPQSGYSMYIFNRDSQHGGRNRANRDRNWQTPVKAGLEIIQTIASFAAGSPVGAIVNIFIGIIRLIIDLFLKKEDTYKQIEQQVLKAIRKEISDDRVHTMKLQLDNWDDGTFFRLARRLHITPMSPDQIHDLLMNGEVAHLPVSDTMRQEYDVLIDELRNLKNDVDYKQNIFQLSSNFANSLAYYHEYAGLDVYLLSALIAANRNLTNVREVYREQLKDSAEDHYNYLMLLFGKQLIYEGSRDGKHIFKCSKHVFW